MAVSGVFGFAVLVVRQWPLQIVGLWQPGNDSVKYC